MESIPPETLEKIKQLMAEYGIKEEELRFKAAEEALKNGLIKVEDGKVILPSIGTVIAVAASGRKSKGDS